MSFSGIEISPNVIMQNDTTAQNLNFICLKFVNEKLDSMLEENWGMYLNNNW